MVFFTPKDRQLLQISPNWGPSVSHLMEETAGNFLVLLFIFVISLSLCTYQMSYIYIYILMCLYHYIIYIYIYCHLYLHYKKQTPGKMLTTHPFGKGRSVRPNICPNHTLFTPECPWFQPSPLRGLWEATALYLRRNVWWWNCLPR